ncbi:MAG: sigma-70 family RNA polymerase sigma factor [Elusimicrobiota bacterium]
MTKPKPSRDELERIVREHSEILLRGALSQGFQMSEAEDLVQETLLTYVKKSDRFEGRSSLRTYLFGILHNKSLERRRKRVRELSVDPVDAVFDRRMSGPNGHWSPPPSGPDDEAQAAELYRMIEECLEGLTDAQRSAFQLKEVLRQGSWEVCNVLDVSDNYLRVLLFRARIKMRNCLEEKGAAA